MHTWIMASGGFFAITGVMLGAFAAHGLKHKLDESMLAIFQTATQYQIYHALALLFSGLYAAQIEQSIRLSLIKDIAHSPSLQTLAGLYWLKISAICFILGIILFSGSLYALAITGQKWLGPFTPIGGLLMIVGWALLIFAFFSP